MQGTSSNTAARCFGDPHGFPSEVYKHLKTDVHFLNAPAEACQFTLSPDAYKSGCAKIGKDRFSELLLHCAL